MSRFPGRRRVVLLLVGVLVVWANEVPHPFAAPPPKGDPAPPRSDAPASTDRHSDPSPAGAIARFGTLRLWHGGEARAVAFSPDGKVVASGGGDRIVRLWDAATGKELRSLSGHRRAVVRLAYSPDGKLLAAGDRDGEIVFWDPATGEELDRFSRYDDGALNELRALAFSPNGKLLAAAHGYTIDLWDIATGKPLPSVPGDMREVYSVAFSPDSKTLAAGTGHGIFMCQPGTGKEGRRIREACVFAVAFFPDGKRLAAGTGDDVLILGAESGEELQRPRELRSWSMRLAIAPDGKSLACTGSNYDRIAVCDLTTNGVDVLGSGRQVEIHDLAFSPNGRRLATAGADNRIRMWDLATGRESLDFGRAPSHRYDVGVLGQCLAPDGATAVTLSGDGSAHVWETATGKEIRRLEWKQGPMVRVALSPDGQTLAAAAEEERLTHTVVFWDLATGRLLGRSGSQRGKTEFIAFAPDGKTVAVGDNATVRLWDVATGREVRSLAGHETTIHAAAFSPDGRVLITAEDGDHLRAWDAATGKELHHWRGHGGFAIVSVAFTPDGSLLASSGADDFITFWDPKTYRPIRRIASPTRWHGLLGFSADGKRLVTEGDENTFCIWDAGTGKLLHRVGGHRADVVAAAFAPNGKTLVSAAADGTALVWDLSALPSPPPAPAVKTDAYGAPLPPEALLRLGQLTLQHEGPINSAAFSPDGKTIATASGGNDGTSIWLWDRATGKELRQFSDYQGWAGRVAFSPDGNILAASSQTAVTFWDPATGERIRRFGGHAHDELSFAFSPDGKLLATAGHRDDGERDCIVRLWDAATGQEVRAMDGPKGQVWQLVFSTDGKRLGVVVSVDKGLDVLVWDPATGKPRRRFHTDARRVRLSSDGNILAIEEETSLQLWNLEAKRAAGRIDLGSEPSEWLFSPDGKLLAANGREQPLRIWDVASREEMRVFREPISPTGYPIAFSPDGKLLATSGDSWNRERHTINDHGIQVWDLTTGREVQPVAGHWRSVTCLAYAPDGKSLASGSIDRTVRLWDAATGKELRCLEGHTAAIVAVCFSPDGRSVVSADDENSLRLWDAATGREQHRRDKLPAPVASLVFAPDGRSVTIAGAEGSVWSWDPGTGKVRLLHAEEIKESRRFTMTPDNFTLAPDSRTLAIATTIPGREFNDPSQGLVRLLDLTTGRVRHEIKGPDEYYRPLIFSGDARLMAAKAHVIDDFHGHDNETNFCLWETATGRQIGSLPAYLTSRLVFSPGGRSLAAAGEGERDGAGSIYLWDVGTARETAVFLGHRGSVTAFAFSPDGRRLASAGADHTVLIWDISDKKPPRRMRSLLASGKIEDHWTDLADTDAARGHRALWSLAAVPGKTVPFLRQRLRPATAPTKEQLNRLIAALDSDQFEDREKAVDELRQLGELAGPALRTLLQNRPSAEARRHAEQLLEKMEPANPFGERLRALRAVAVLEAIDTPEARELLRRLADGAAESFLTREAKAALARLGR